VIQTRPFPEEDERRAAPKIAGTPRVEPCRWVGIVQRKEYLLHVYLLLPH
jgi:hypothetical protein